jgi:hypothetical protein
MTTINGNGGNGQTAIGLELHRAKRDRANRVRRINRQLSKDGGKLCSAKGADGVRRYYHVNISSYLAIDLEDLERRINCDFCHRPSRRQLGKYGVCDSCAQQLGYEESKPWNR